MSDSHPPRRRRLPVPLLIALVAGAAVVAEDPLGWFSEAPLRFGETLPELQALRTLGAAQALFRESDRDGDGQHRYGTLAQLGAAGLIDEALAAGLQHQHRFDATVSATRSEFLWFATATPVSADPQQRCYATNHEGLVFYSTHPIAPSGDCAMPEGVLPLRR